MTRARRDGIIIGSLFIIGIISYLIGHNIIDSTFESSMDIVNILSSRIRIGVLLEFLNAAAMVAIAIIIYPYLRITNESMALGYTVSRIIEAVLLTISAISPLILISISNNSMELVDFQSFEILTESWYDISFSMAMMVLGIGSMFLCYILYKSKLIPRILIIFGFLGYLMMLASGFIYILYPETEILQYLYIPGVFFELLFSIWLIIKGFNKEEVEDYF